LGPGHDALHEPVHSAYVYPKRVLRYMHCALRVDWHYVGRVDMHMLPFDMPIVRVRAPPVTGFSQ
jgi:hypothetical protein